MIELKLRLEDGLANRLAQLHPAYGERSRVLRELIAAYVESAKPAKVAEAQVIGESVRKVRG